MNKSYVDIDILYVMIRIPFVDIDKLYDTASPCRHDIDSHVDMNKSYVNLRIPRRINLKEMYTVHV